MKRILITGGTGSFGKAFINYLLKHSPEIEKIIIYSRDELKQWELQKLYPADVFPQLRFYLGDVRDRNRLCRALEGVDTVVHAAALKHVPAGEKEPIEFIKTNVIGSENLVQACLDSQVKKLVALSTDKAAAPINLYGATKLCADKLFIAANNLVGSRDLSFSVVRYGNVMGSRGSVIPFFMSLSDDDILPITSLEMTRFNITLSSGCAMVYWAIKNSIGGEIFVPKIPSYRILDVAKAVAPNSKIKVVGLRPGEKIHEEMITSSDSEYTFDLGPYYSIMPSSSLYDEEYLSNQYSNLSVSKVPENFSYNSKDNPDFLSVEQLRDLIDKNINVHSR
ncbi:UDP-N-acetylglucosamine 4,6-dehydratase (inverting) [Synechococcus sp. HIMB2401]|uniref:UDP-N-acetylglucosamine 4,6-dehydratase (inverting) n=1 Tax=Synechococcus sp. HIMB2401 TaxID=3144208 RepID=UPI0036F3071B